MKNMMSYLKQNKYNSFDVLPFNDIDALLLAQISYLNIELTIENVSKVNKVVVKEKWKKLCDKTMTFRGNKKLSKCFSDNTRYKDVLILDYYAVASNDQNTQFFAMTFDLGDFIYIAYRGTDLTIYGWREDFNMLFEHTNSQREAVNYLEFVYKKFNKPMIVGGHSKGGNLAIFGSMYSKDEIKKNILKIFNFDGPGFYRKDIYDSIEFKSIKDRLVSITSKVSVVSILLYKVPGVRYIKTNSISVLTHDAFNWGVDLKENNFKFVRTNTFSSRLLDEAADIYIEETTTEERKELVEITFKIVTESPNMTLVDVVHHPLAYLKRMKVRHKALNKEENKFLEEEIKKIRKILKNVFKNSIIGKNGIKKDTENKLEEGVSNE